jgi:hypothetical protein
MDVSDAASLRNRCPGTCGAVESQTLSVIISVVQQLHAQSGIGAAREQGWSDKLGRGQGSGIGKKQGGVVDDKRMVKIERARVYQDN